MTSYHTKVRCLSKGKILSRLVFSNYGTRSQVDFVAQQKMNFCQHFVEMGMLPYLVNVFEALYQLNKKLQGSGSNIIMRTDAINAFKGKLKLGSQRAINDNFTLFHRLTDVITDRGVTRLGGARGKK